MRMANLQQENNDISQQLRELTVQLKALVETLELARQEEKARMAAFAELPPSIEKCMRDIQAAVNRIAPPDSESDNEFVSTE